MSRLLILTGCCTLLTVLVGCGENQQPKLDQSKLMGKARSKLPDCVIGVWKSNNYGWGFKFEPDGSILKMRHMLAGYVRMEEGGVLVEGLDEDTYAVYVMGQCKTDYEPDTRMLEVEAFIDEYEMQLHEGKLEGRTEDYFSGQISEDCTTWQVNWRSYSWLEGADPPDPNLIEANPMKLIFTKMQIDLSGGN